MADFLMLSGLAIAFAAATALVFGCADLVHRNPSAPGKAE